MIDYELNHSLGMNPNISAQMMFAMGVKMDE